MAPSRVSLDVTHAADRRSSPSVISDADARYGWPGLNRTRLGLKMLIRVDPL